MRIIAGRFKGRRLQAPRGLDVRPTSDGLRETLFNVLGETVVGARVLDGFAGTGALGLEALSRGAAARDLRRARRRGRSRRCATTPHLRRRRRVCYHPRRFSSRAQRHRARPSISCCSIRRTTSTISSDVVEAAASLVAPGGRLVLEHSRGARAAPAKARQRAVAGDSALLVAGRQRAVVL